MARRWASSACSLAVAWSPRARAHRASSRWASAPCLLVLVLPGQRDAAAQVGLGGPQLAEISVAIRHVPQADGEVVLVALPLVDGVVLFKQWHGAAGLAAVAIVTYDASDSRP